MTDARDCMTTGFDAHSTQSDSQEELKSNPMYIGGRKGPPAMMPKLSPASAYRRRCGGSRPLVTGNCLGLQALVAPPRKQIA